MTYIDLTTDELVMIEAYYHQNIAVTTISARLKRSRMTVYNEEGHTPLVYYQQYKKNKQRYRRRKIVLPTEQQVYINEKVAQGWTPDIIVGQKEMPIACSMRTLYRRFKEKQFDETTLPMKGKRKPNGHQERRGKQAFKRNIAERETDYPAFPEEFGHLEGDTIMGVQHKSAVITLVEQLSKIIITLKPYGRKANDIENTMNHSLESIHRNLFKSITFDRGKEFSNSKALSNQQDIAIYFVDSGTLSQRELNENFNGLLRKEGLPNEMDFNQVDQAFVSSVANKRNNLLRKSLDYQTPLEVFLSYLDKLTLSILN